MVSHRSVSGSASGNLRLCGIAAAYAFAMVTGTAILMAALTNHRDGSETGSDGQRVTAAELVMQHSAELGVHSPERLLKAFRTLPNDKRGI